jgi:hypothetical protein
LCDALVELGVPATMLRVSAAVDTPTGRHLLGSFGDGPRQPAASPGRNLANEWLTHFRCFAGKRLG